jgi:TonB-dependent receptor
MKTVYALLFRFKWRSLRATGLFVTGLMLLLPARAQTAGTGTINGTARNEGTGDFLEGAEVRIVGTERVTTTQRDGSFAFTGVPAGRQQLRAFYTGLDVQETTVTVTPNAIATVPLALNSAVYKLEAFTVAGQREGNAAAITRQRTAENIKSVVSMDAYGNVADGNIGNFLQNLTGVAVNKEAGDIVGIGLRGTPPELNSVTLDGARTAGATTGFSPQGDRASLIDQVPSELIKEIEITKGNTPDQSADSLGGTVNLVTKSAFDFKQRVITYRLGVNLNTYREGNFVRGDHGWVDLGKYGPTAALTYLDTFGADRKWGVALSGSFSQTINTRDRVQMNRPNVDNLISTRARQLNDIDTRVRAGISGKLEYRLDETLRVGLGASFNYYTFAGDRSDWDITSANGVADYSRVSRAAIVAGSTPRNSANAAAGIAPGFTDTYNELLHATIRNRSSSGKKLSQQSKFGLEGQKRWIDTLLVMQASYNPSNSRQKSYLFEARRTGGVGIGIDTSNDPSRPVYTQTYGATIGPGSDFNNYSGSNTRRILTDDYTFEDITSARADLQHKFSRLAFPITFKTGVDYRRQHRWYRVFGPNWNLVGADGVAGLNPATGRNDDNIGSFVNPNYRYSLFNNSMMQRDHLDYRIAEDLFQSNPSYWVPSSATTLVRGVARRITEGVSSSYAQAKVTLGKLNVLGGARFEHTDVKGVGSLSDPQAATQSTTTVASAYQAWYPSIHLKYNLSSDFLLRASYSTSGARPAISALVPDTSVSYNTDGRGLGRVTRNNPGLKPQNAQTYDFSAEYYVEPAGVVSAGVFRKDITDFLYRATSIIGDGSNNGFDGRYEGFELTSTGNLGSALVEGVELNYSQQLRWLPKPFDGLSVFANYTRLRTEGSYAEGVAELADFVPTTYNIGGNFSYRNFQARATYHFKSGYLDNYNANPGSQSRVTDDPTVDLNLQYRVRPSLTVFIDLINVFNKSPDWVSVSPRHITMSELYGARLNVGVSGRF